jgi:hypothetical protein
VEGGCNESGGTCDGAMEPPAPCEVVLVLYSRFPRNIVTQIYFNYAAHLVVYSYLNSWNIGPDIHCAQVNKYSVWQTYVVGAILIIIYT